MPRGYELPTHLQVDDTLGLTARQLVRLAVGASLAYQVWDISAGLPTAVRGGLAILPGAGLLFALFPPAGGAGSMGPRARPLPSSAAAAGVAFNSRVGVCRPPNESGGPSWQSTRRGSRKSPNDKPRRLQPTGERP